MPKKSDKRTQEQREQLVAILRAVRKLEALGVNVLGLLHQALDGERAIGTQHGEPDPAYAERAAAALRADTESSVPLFAPSLLWTLAHLRTDLWNGIESKEYQIEARGTLGTIADAIADRRAGPGAPPKAGGEVQRDEERERLVALLAEIGTSATDEIRRATSRRDEEPAYYARLLLRLRFWERLDKSIPFDLDSPRRRAMYQLNRDVFDHVAHRDRPTLRNAVAAMVAALLDGEVDTKIFGGGSASDKRPTARSLAHRVLDKYLSRITRIQNV